MHSNVKIKMISPFPAVRPVPVFVIPLACEPNDVVVCANVSELRTNAEIYGVPMWAMNMVLKYMDADKNATCHLLIDRKLFEHLK